MKMFYDWVYRYWILLTVLVMVTITVLSLTPLPQLPDVPGTDKTHHLIAYAALAFPTALRQPKYFYGLILLMVGYGGTIEIIQPYVNRYGEWLDFSANSLGILVGILLANLLKRVLSRHIKDKRV